MPHRIVRWIAAALVFAAPALHAQAAAPAQDSVRRNLLLLNPIGVVFSIYNGEYEHVATPAFSMG
jgi:hypothetical protein